MKQMDFTPDLRIEIDFKSAKRSRTVNTLQPVVFKDDNSFCCLLGPDLNYGIKGFGHTADEAIDDWETSLKKRIKTPSKNDELAKYVVSMLKAGN